MSIVILDTETTGINPYKDRVVEVALLEWEEDTVESLWLSEPRDTGLWLINPEMPIPEEVAAIHGITDEKVKDAPRFAEIGDQIAQHIKRATVLIGHNPYFDRTMLNMEFRKLALTISFPRLICTKRLWDIYEPKEQRHLQNAYRRFVNKVGFDNAHSAMADILACHSVICAQVKEFGLEGKTFEELDPNASLYWGPSNHIVWADGILCINFGKWKGTPCHLVEKSYWEWVQRTDDFPEHLKVLADFMKGAPVGYTGEALATWAYGQGL